MYIELVSRVIEDAIELHASEAEQSKEELLQRVSKHIEATSREYRKAEPQIEYRDPLCRLGYLYMHAAANATLFERVVGESDDLRGVITGSAAENLNVCSLGGGPGTELLGLAKFFLRRPNLVPPRKITFTVIDNVLEWAETWHQLADAVEEEFRSSFADTDVELPSIAPTFLPLDVLKDSSYRDYAYQFKKADLVVFNYLFSENKTRLEQTLPALQHLARITRPECTFVMIDRLEHDISFTNRVVECFTSAFGVEVNYSRLGGTLDADEQTSEMGEMLLSTLKRRPRVKFFTDQYRDPTVFWFVIKRG